MKRLIDGRMALLLFFNFVPTTLLVVLLVMNSHGRSETRKSELFKKVALKLQSAGLSEEAIKNYERYLNSGSLTSDERYNAAVNIASLYEEAKRYSEALAYLYLADGEDNAKKDGDLNSRIVSLLERSGKSSAAMMELSARTKLGATETPKGAVMVAKVDGKPLYKHEVDKFIDQLPSDFKSSLIKDNKQRKSFTLKYIADQLLYNKAIRAKRDNDSDILDQLEFLKRSLLVSKTLEGEAKFMSKVDPADLKNYFEAHKERYQNKNGKKLSFDEVRSRIEMEYKMEKAQGHYSTLLDEAVKNGSVEIYDKDL